MAIDVGDAPLRRVTGGGINGNERLTGITGILLIVLLAALGVTILRLRSLTDAHMFIGLLLIPPIALKMVSTGYRFIRYYLRHPVYRERGAPPTALRLMAPVVVLSTIAVFATGIALLAIGPDASGALRMLHKASFIVWIGATAIHVLAHLPDLQTTFLLRSSDRVQYNRYAAGAVGRAISIAGALTAGLVVAILLVPHFGAWSHFEAFQTDH